MIARLKIIKWLSVKYCLNLNAVEIDDVNGQTDVEFYGESYDDKHVTVSHCTNFCTKNLEKVENHEYSGICKKNFSIFLHFPMCSFIWRGQN